jgi:hypothetical protein
MIDSIFRNKGKWLAATVVFLALFALWRFGTFDHALANWGLNAKPCARNGLGATFCGKELEERQQQQRTLESERQHREARLEAEATERKKKTEEQQARIQAEGRAARRHSEEEQAALRHSQEETQQRLAEQSREAQEAIKQSVEQSG